MNPQTQRLRLRSLLGQHRRWPLAAAVVLLVIGGLARTERTGVAPMAAQAQPAPEEQKKVIIGLYNRYCIRCHGLDGRGVWDIPKVPDFTDKGWQASRSDAQMVRAILEGGKGTPEKRRDSLKLPPPSKHPGILHWAVMPSFRDILTPEQASGMARFLRNFVPAMETPEDAKKKPSK
jgi:mono/diheme cytochrome c family protein